MLYIFIFHLAATSGQLLINLKITGEARESSEGDYLKIYIKLLNKSLNSLLVN
jgi:hypothetical protein